MAGVDKEIEGEATPMPNLNIGYLPQEPQLDPRKPCAKRWKTASAKSSALRKSSMPSTRRTRNPTPTLTPRREQAKYEAILATSDGARRSNNSKSPPTHCACRRGTQNRTPVGRRKAPCGAVQVAAAKTDMLLLDEPTNHLDADRWIGRTIPHTLSGYVVAVTHDRYFLDNAANGFSNSTAATVFHGRATTAAGSTRNRIG